MTKIIKGAFLTSELNKLLAALSYDLKTRREELLQVQITINTIRKTLHDNIKNLNNSNNATFYKLIAVQDCFKAMHENATDIACENWFNLEQEDKKNYGNKPR